jgi:hypothetical protein
MVALPPIDRISPDMGHGIVRMQKVVTKMMKREERFWISFLLMVSHIGDVALNVLVYPVQWVTIQAMS